MSLQDLIITLKYGTARSGDWGHRGRPGEVGGSGGGGGLAGLGLKPDSTAEERRMRSTMARSAAKREATNPSNPGDIKLMPDWLQKRLGYKPDGEGSSLKGQSQKKPSKLYKETTPAELVKDNSKIVGVNTPYNAESKQQSLDSLIERYPATGPGVVNYVAGLATYKDPTTGYEFRKIDVRTSLDDTYVTADIVDSSGKRIGNVVRIFNHTKKDVHHDYMQLDKSAQGTGFGARFYHESEKAYKQAGFETTSIYANIDVGGYAWARMGYDVVPGSYDFSKLASLTNTAIKQWEQRSGATFEGKIPSTMPELAALTAPDGERIGKNVLLGESWKAIKKLDDNDPSYQAGLEYYRQKGVEVD